MEQKLKITMFISFILGIISFGWLIYDLTVFEHMRPIIIAFQPLGAYEEWGKYVFFGIIVAFFFHLVSLAGIIIQFQYFKRITLFKLFTLFAGIISLICLIGDFAALTDIGKQYDLKLTTTMEWIYLYFSLLAHGLFYIFNFILLFSLNRDLKKQQQTEFALKDEVVFNIAQYAGVLCGFLGLCFNLYLLFINISPRVLKYIIPFYCPFIIFPYCFIFIYWLVMKRKEKFADWYDEKQWWDITKASLTTILVSVPGMAVLYIVNYFMTTGVVSVIWFPSYLFMILFLFSGSTLYYNRQNS